MEDLFRKQPGVLSTKVGYIGGASDNPTYKDICTGTTGHAEALLVQFDPEQISFQALLLFFFKVHDPTTLNRQGNDRGTQYRSAIFPQSRAQKETAEQIISSLNAAKVFELPIVTTIEEDAIFYNAEDFHQDYLEKNPGGYTCHFIRHDLDFSKVL